jgi:hypothetical protein
MSALNYQLESRQQPELDFAPPEALPVIRLASPEDQPSPSPVAAMQADLQAQLVHLQTPGRWPVGAVLLALMATGAIMWWAIIGGVLALMHG